MHHPKPLTLKLESKSTTKTADVDPLLPKFPLIFTGPIFFTLANNINNDGICPVMNNHDPTFLKTVANLLSSSSATPLRKTEQSKININLTNQAQRTGTGVVLVVGKNFGTGFPQEQVATALRNAGIPLVMSASVERIFERDAISHFLIKKFNVLSKGGFTLVTCLDLSLDSRAGIVNIPNPSGQILSKLAIFHLQVSTNQYFCPSSPAQETKVSMEVWVDEIKLHWAADNKKHGCLRRDLSRELKCTTSKIMDENICLPNSLLVKTMGNRNGIWL
ncbi:hypothetical protein MJO29_011735, partial [Puccinia striiformis f. sp. tritici]